jgi:hypothetical protein
MFISWCWCCCSLMISCWSCCPWLPALIISRETRRHRPTTHTQGLYLPLSVCISAYVCISRET